MRSVPVTAGVFADLPPDKECYAQALSALGDFAEMSIEAQDSLLELIAQGGGHDDGPLSPKQMQQWFEDLCADLVRLWLAHPATLAHIGFDGFANGGDGERIQGYVQLAAGEQEAWEPR